MTEWLLLVLLVPAIVVPVVLLLGFAGCDIVFGLDHVGEPGPAPVIESATGKSLSVITLTWKIDPTATHIEFERTKIVPTGPVDMSTIRVAATPTTYDDSGLEPDTTYIYRATAIFADGDKSSQSPSVTGTTLSFPAFDATGAGGSGAGATSAAATWSHTASAEADAVVVGLRWAQNILFAPAGEPTRTARYGGNLMTSLGVVGLNNAALTGNNGNFIYQEFFGLLNPPTGTKTVEVSVERVGAQSLTVEGCSVSYVAVSAFGPVSAVAGTEAGTTLSQTVASALSETIVQMFTVASGPITNYTATLRYSGTANGIGLALGDIPGAPSVPITAVRAEGVDYAGLAAQLTPIT